MHRFKKGDVVMVVDMKCEEDGLDTLESACIFVGDLGVVDFAGSAFVPVTFIMTGENEQQWVPCRSHELHYIGRL